MRYLYTTTPDEGCHEVEPGIFGRPVQTCDESDLMKRGWKLSINALRGTDHVRQEKEGREEGQEVAQEIAQREAYRELWAAEYEDKFGKRPHHKMKAETIRKKLEGPDG